jgi:hypothetical protein
MTMSGANYTKHFTNIGKHVDLYNQIEAWKSAIVTVEGEAAAILKDDDDENAALKALLVLTRALKATLENSQAQLGSAVGNYCKEGLRKDLGYTGSSKNLVEILEALAEDMVEAAESVDGSAIAAVAPTYDAQNAGTGALSTPASLTQLLTDEYFELECTDTSTVGSEVWEVRGEPDEHGVLPDSLTSAVAYTGYDDNDQALFAMTLTPYAAGVGTEITGDTDSEIGATTWTGATKGTNTDTAGDVFLVLDRLSAAEAGDNNNQVSNEANITGVALCKNCDIDGKLYISIVDDTGGYFHIDLYKATARAAGDLVGHTATYNSTGAKAIVADNSSGLGGTITVDAVTAADVDISYVCAFDRVKVYKETGLSNVVAAGGKVAGGATTLYAQNSSGLGGTVAVTYSDGEAKVQVRVGFAFAVGDKIYFTTTNDEAGTFAEFFRKELGVAPAVNLAAGETQADSLAE